MVIVFWDTGRTRRWAERAGAELRRAIRETRVLTRVSSRRRQRLIEDITHVDVCPGYVFCDESCAEMLHVEPEPSLVRMPETALPRIPLLLWQAVTAPEDEVPEDMAESSGSDELGPGDRVEGTGVFDGYSGEVTRTTPQGPEVRFSSTPIRIITRSVIKI